MIGNKEEKLLESLATYKFLSRAQMSRIGIEQYNSNYSKLTKDLLEANYIGVLDARAYGLGFIYFLREKGARIISEHLRTALIHINYVKSDPTLSSQTLYHRKYCIDFQIEFNQFCTSNEIQVLEYIREIESIGSIRKNKNLERKTRVKINNGKYLEPDGITLIETPRGQKLYAIELEHKSYTKKSLEKIKKHMEAFALRAFSQKMEYAKAWRVLFIYYEKGTMDSVIKQCSTIEGIGNWFLFRTYESSIAEVSLSKGKFSSSDTVDLYNGWVNANGESVTLF